MEGDITEVPVDAMANAANLLESAKAAPIGIVITR